MFINRLSLKYADVDYLLLLLKLLVGVLLGVLSELVPLFLLSIFFLFLLLFEFAGG
jgi:hypothetical protein